ncbi:MAG: M42 family peptidase, partial [Nitrospinota bacterium]
RGPNINPKVFTGLWQTAEKLQIPVQIEGAPSGTGTDANAIQLSRAGVAAGLVSIPNRYMHTPCEMVALSDVEQAAQLLAGYIRTLTPETSLIPTE